MASISISKHRTPARCSERANMADTVQHASKLTPRALAVRMSLNVRQQYQSREYGG